MSISRSQLRAARVLLCLSQEELSALSEVGVATIRRYESGAGATKQSLETLRTAVEAAGAIILNAQEIGGRRIGDGVALAEEGELPPETVKRIQARLEDAPEGRSGLAGRPHKRKI